MAADSEPGGGDLQAWPYESLAELDAASLVQANMEADFMAMVRRQIVGAMDYPDVAQRDGD